MLYVKKNIVLLILLMLLPLNEVFTQTQSKAYPQESLSNRLKKIGENYSKTIAFDTELVKNIQVKAVKAEAFTVEQVLAESLSATAFTYKKTSSNAYIIIKKPSSPRPSGIGTGKITGKITDENGEALPGVTIRVSNTTSGAITDLSGYYKLTLSSGTYSLEVSAISYQKQNITDVEVSDDKATELSLSMAPSNTQLNDVVVIASFKKSSVQNLYLQQRKSGLVTNGISADLIARTPDKNVGESLRRISGITTTDNRYIVVRGMGERYNGNMLNGQLLPSTELNRKNFNYDIFPSSIVDNITVVKTITPDRSAEFGGGLVDITTKDIPNEDFLQVSIGTSVNDKTTGKEFRALQLDNNAYWGQTPENRKLLGSLDWNKPQEAFDAYDKAGNKASLFSNNWNLYKWSALPSYNGQISFGKVLDMGANRKFGFIGSASYRHTLQTADINTGKDGWQNSINKFTGAGGESYTFSTTVSGLAGVGYRDENTRISLQQLYLASYNQQLAVVDNGNTAYFGNWGYYDNTSQTTMWQTQLKGEHTIGDKGIKINWLGSYVSMDRQRPDNHFILGDAKVSEDDNTQVSIVSAGARLSAGGPLRNWTRAKENNFTWDANVLMPFTIASNKQSLKFGYGGWYKKRLMYVINAFSMNDHSNNNYYVPLKDLYSAKYAVEIELDRRFNDGYQRSAPLHAPYLMIDNRLGEKLRLVWGVRAELYDVDKLSNDTTGNSVGNKLNYFPSANFTYSLNEQMNFRLAYSRSIIRPDLRELANFRAYDWELGGNYYANALRYTFLDNYDFRYEWYPSAGEIVSLSAFYKHIDYPMEIAKETGNDSYVLQNSREALNYGLELEIRKNFAFTNLPVLKNITLSGNITLIDGKVKPMYIGFMEVDGKSQMTTKVYDWVNRLQQGASPMTYNLGIYYDGSRLSASVLYNKMGVRSTMLVGTGGDDLKQSYNYYEEPASSLDAQIAVKLLKSKKLELKLSASNLLDSYSITYYKSVGEKIYQKYNPTDCWVSYRSANGRSCSATVSYKF